VILLEFECSVEVLQKIIENDSGLFRKSSETTESLSLKFFDQCKQFCEQNFAGTKSIFLAYASSSIDAAVRTTNNDPLNIIEFRDSSSMLDKKIMEDWLLKNSDRIGYSPRFLCVLNDDVNHEKCIEAILNDTSILRGSAFVSLLDGDNVKVSVVEYPSFRLDGAVIGAVEFDYRLNKINQYLASQLKVLPFFSGEHDQNPKIQGAVTKPNAAQTSSPAISDSVEKVCADIRAKYQNDGLFEELKSDLVCVERNGASFYELKRLGFQLSEYCDDKNLASRAFYHALRLAETHEDTQDVIDEISFMSATISSELEKDLDNAEARFLDLVETQLNNVSAETQHSTSINIILNSRPDNTTPLIRELRDILGLNTKRAKDLIDQPTPSIIASVQNADRALEILNKLEPLGIDITTSTSGSPPSGSNISLDGLTPFLCRIRLNSDAVESAGGLEAVDLKNITQLILDSINWFVESVSIRLSMGDPCYLLPKSAPEQPILLNPTGGNKSDESVQKLILEMLKTQSTASLVDYETVDDGYLHIVVWTSGNDHWDYNFLKLSSTFAQDEVGGEIKIIGSHPDFGDIVYQIYDAGEYDSGIQIDDEDDSYTGLQVLVTHGLSDSIFSESSYLRS